MQHSNTYRQTVKETFDRHNPLDAHCLSVYESVVSELFLFWLYSDSINELEYTIRKILEQHRKPPIQVSHRLVADIYETKHKLLG